MLEVRNVSAAYTSATIIEDVSLDLGAGEIKAVLGRNGVGKSTLMKCIAGVLPALSGTTSLQGKALPASAARRARLGVAYVPQGRDIFPRLTTTENIEVAAHACGHDARAAVEGAFEQFPALRERAHVMGGNLSGGQQQILAIARALALKPSVMLLDEPTEGIQPSIIQEIQGILRELNRSEGVAILLAEQNLDFVSGLATECYLMNKGRIEQRLPMEEIRHNPELVQEMLGV
ncbi:ABC transporter ATP-binding protein [Arhodomonas sp. SL1]|uniref:ABC transporter ATP-binding protein n=1 Tax=Arhodomonas sp. SL1 TaxID=3425691 RepID=UPI003F880A9D